MIRRRAIYRLIPAAMLAALILCAAGAPAAAQPDPRDDWQGYQDWCADQDGAFYNDSRGVGCDVSSSPSTGYEDYGYQDYGSYGYGFDPELYMYEMGIGLLGNMLNSFMTCALDPNCGVDHEAEARRQAQLEEQRAQQAAFRAEQKRLREEAEAEQHRKFEAAKERIFDEMRTTTIELLQPRDLGSGVLIVAPEDKGDLIFGQPILKPRTVVDLGSMTPWEKASCAGYLLGAANRAAFIGASEGDPLLGAAGLEEAAYLSHQASLLMGEAGSIEVACPVPKVGSAGPTADSAKAGVAADKAWAEMLRKQSTLQSKLFSRSAQQMESFPVAQASVEEANKEVEAARERQEKAQRELEEIESALLELPAPEAPAEEEEPAGETTGFSVLGQISSERSQLEDLTRERQAELDLHNDALKAAEKNLADEAAAFAQLQAEMGDTLSMLQQLQEKPGAMDSVLQQLSEAEEAPSGG